MRSGRLQVGQGRSCPFDRLTDVVQDDIDHGLFRRRGLRSVSRFHLDASFVISARAASDGIPRASARVARASSMESPRYSVRLRFSVGGRDALA
ncbi:hypothetical protein Bphy_4782 [Paraburkholderia phymatum STM815]|uniref:Uncharacterized protein n=1 Tax=Paraburkholderia phymatum (strain DSM 17167 / CIP 108236 / LMG 21445 / STM815) TaxID=391038 RepID=B2JRX2_PARP8|nr:hypothetical protein Bphy_4782 [Paraburkholderia phymatum STM815]